MNTLHRGPLAAPLLAGFGTVALLTSLGLFASRPAHSVGGPVAVSIANVPLATTPTDVAAPSQPVGVQQIITVTNGVGTVKIYTVPAGKRLVIQTLTATTQFVTDTPGSYSVVVGDDGFKQFCGFPMQPSGSLATGTQAVHFYFNAGTTIDGRVFGKSSANDTIGVGLSGYLVNMP